MTLEAARAMLTPLFAAKQGRSTGIARTTGRASWRSTSRALKHDMREHVRFLPGAQEFLQALADGALEPYW